MSISWFRNAPTATGRGSFEHLARLESRRTAVVADTRAISAGGGMERIGRLFDTAGAAWALVHDARREPRMTDVDVAREELRRFDPDTILAIGGGSALDVAKALWFFHEFPGATWAEALVPFGIPPMGRRARLVAVPTTSGTGSETTCVAVFVDDTGRKRLMMSPELIPSLAILDPDLVDSVPDAVAAASGMDALSHAIEAAVCRRASPMVQAVAIEAAACLLEWLPLSVREPPSGAARKEAREIVHYAASRAGMAINNSSAGLSHAMDQIGPVLGIPHGLACGIALPSTIAFLGQQPSFRRIEKAAGTASLAGSVWDLGRRLGLPSGYAECGLDEKRFESLLDGLVADAVASGSTQVAPRVPLREDFVDMFRESFRGLRPADRV
jgi:alcohol dehydrogenase class IV